MPKYAGTLSISAFAEVVMLRKDIGKADDTDLFKVKVGNGFPGVGEGN